MEDFSLLQSHTVLWICWRANNKKKDIKIGKYDLQRKPPPCMVYGTHRFNISHPVGE
jgi:cell division protein YceG involved in septum cleavage